MHRPLKSRSLVSTILLFSLSFPLPLLSITLGIERVSAQVQTSQSRRDELLRLNNIGLQQLNRGEFREALETFEQALVIVREIGERQDEGTILNNIGLVYDSLGQYPRALEYYQQALDIRKEVGDKSAEGTTLSNIGLVYRSLGEYPRALEYYSQALDIRKQVGDKPGEGTTLSNIGLVYRNLGEYPRALEYYSQALAISKQVGNSSGEGTTLNNIGAVYNSLGQYPRALEYYSQALAIDKQVGNKRGEGTTLSNIGNVYNSLGEYPRALEYYSQALAIRKQVGDKPGEGTTLNNIGAFYHSLGQYPRALEYFSQALAIDKQVGNKAGEGTTLNNIGGVYDNLGEYPRALEYFSQALAIHKQVGNKAGEGTTLNNIGNVYRNLGEYPRALEYYEQALAIIKQVGDKRGEGTTLNNIGYVYNSLGEYPRALEYYEQALAIDKQVGNKAGEGTTLNNIGAFYHSFGLYPRALEYFSQALAISKQVGDRQMEGTTLNNIGNVYDSLGQYPRALEYYSQALAIRKQVGDKRGEGTTLNNIGYVYNNLGQYADAEKTLFAAIEVLESLRARELPDANKISIFEIHAHTYRFLQQSLVAQNKINTALEVAERGRARAFVELLASRLSDNPNSQLKVEKPTIAQIQKIAKEQNATLVQYSIVYEVFKVEGKIEWRTELFIWVIKPTGEIAFKQVDLKNTPLHQFAEAGRVAAATSRGLEPPDTGIANFVRGTRQSITSSPVFKDPGIPEPNFPNNPQELKQLHDLLIKPIADQLPTNQNARVIFIPYQSLYLVPFPALQDANGKYLIEKHTILTAPSIQVLEQTRQRKKAVGRGGFPNPPVQKLEAGKDKSLIVGNPIMPAMGQPPRQLNSLPFAEKEAVEIARMLNSQAITGSQATETTIKQQMPNARIIHLATHGTYNNINALESWVAFTPSGNEDGLLKAGEIFDLRLNAELVVLSACDTGRGALTADGVIGLSRSFISAGVPSIIVSLWSVEDNSTAFLMQEFYRQMQTYPDKAQALRQAMLKTMKEKKYSAPYHWAAFTIIGEAE